jgi:hypothetical protein
MPDVNNPWLCEVGQPVEDSGAASLWYETEINERSTGHLLGSDRQNPAALILANMGVSPEANK